METNVHVNTFVRTNFRQFLRDPGRSSSWWWGYLEKSNGKVLVFLGGDPEPESVVNVLSHCQSVNHFLHERQAKMTVLQQREASLATNGIVISNNDNRNYWRTFKLHYLLYDLLRDWSRNLDPSFNVSQPTTLISLLEKTENNHCSMNINERWVISNNPCLIFRSIRSLLFYILWEYVRA